MKVVITGGYGFIGSYAVKKFLKCGHSVLNIDKLSYASDISRLDKIRNLKNYHFLKKDICDNKLFRTVEKFYPDLIINFAAETHVDNSIKKPADFINTNIYGTYNLLKIALNIFNKRKKENRNFKYIQISTDEVFGSINIPFKFKKFDEKSPYRSNSPYSSSKAASDLIVRSWRKTYGLPTIITYCTNNFGPKQNSEKFIPTIINSLKLGKKVPVYGDGNNKREWIFVEDHIEYIYKISRMNSYKESYCISDGNLFSNLRLLKKILKFYNFFSNKKIKFNKCFEFVNDRLGHDFCYSLRHSKDLKKISNKKNFDLLLKKTIKTYL